MRKIDIAIPGRGYQIVIGSGAIREITSVIGGASSLAVIVDDAVMPSATVVVNAAAENGVRAFVYPIRSSEAIKSIATVDGLLRSMAERGHDRQSVVVAVGGGVVGDIGGFVAATYMRGVPLVQVPTTLLSMVDASVGGKNGVNVRMENGGLAKNLVGTFWQPRAVLADIESLRTLSHRHLRCGLAECVKHAMIEQSALGSACSSGARGFDRRSSLLGWLEAKAEGIRGDDVVVLTELVARSVAVKAAIVARDEREAGERALLNLGHTYAHAIEATWPDEVLHGEAVAIGLVAATAAAGQLGLSPWLDIAGMQGVLTSVGLPVRIPHPMRTRVLVRAMEVDKKRKRGAHTLVIPDGPATARVVEGVSDEVVIAGWSAVGAETD